MNNSRDWWNGLDNIWQKILVLNLGLELEMGGVKKYINEHRWGFKELENLYEEGVLCRWFKDQTEISDEFIKKIVNLQALLVKRAEINDLTPLSMLNKLEILDCSSSKIKNIDPLKNLFNLQELNLAWNNITSVDPLKNLKKLRVLNIWMNNILTLMPIENLENLEEIFCLHNLNEESWLIPRLSRNWKKLKRLSADEIINLQNLPAFCPDLEYLYVQGLKGDLSIIRQLKRLKELYIHSNGIINLDPLTELTNLESLTCGRNQMESIGPLRNLNKLEYLDFEINKIVDLSPLHKLVNLKFLGFQNNQIESLEPLKDLINLEHLDCSNDLLYSKVVCSNKIKSLSPLNNLSNLKWLNCKNNPIPPRELIIFKAIHPNCEVVF